MPLVERALKHRERGVPTSNRAREKGSKAITLDEPLLGDPLQGGHSSSLRPTIFIQRDNLLLSYDTIASSNGKKKKKIRWNRASRVWWQKMILSLKDVRVHSLQFSFEDSSRLISPYYIYILPI